ncbi:DUF3460 family protein [Massilia genomosp. 1]|nr:DUF3460 family protein [Massilia genomosp. 1]
MKHAEKYRPASRQKVSEFEQFMHDYLARHPEVEQDRQRGWHRWWDHRVGLDELDKQRENALPVRPYVYD